MSHNEHNMENNIHTTPTSFGAESSAPVSGGVWSDILTLLRDFLKDSRHSSVAQSTALVDFSAHAQRRVFNEPSPTTAVGYKDRYLVHRMLLYSRFASSAYGFYLFCFRRSFQFNCHAVKQNICRLEFVYEAQC